MSFDVKKQTLHTESVLKPLLEDFKKLPMCRLGDLPPFSGAGVYALYLVEPSGSPYEGMIHRDIPIYVGKAVPEGWRQGRALEGVTRKLRGRLNEHGKSLDSVGLKRERFNVRFAVLDGAGLDLISSLESALVREYQPLWNSYVDGFGNHDPGKGRYEQSPSEWDTLHPGRVWADRLTGIAPRLDSILEKIKVYRNI